MMRHCYFSMPCVFQEEEKQVQWAVSGRRIGARRNIALLLTMCSSSLCPEGKRNTRLDFEVHRQKLVNISLEWEGDVGSPTLWRDFVLFVAQMIKGHR